MKPISTRMKPLRSVELATMAESPATIERSDVCAVPAAAVVGEAMVAIVLADALVEKFGGDSIEELVANWKAFSERTSPRFSSHRCALPFIVAFTHDSTHPEVRRHPHPPPRR